MNPSIFQMRLWSYRNKVHRIRTARKFRLVFVVIIFLVIVDDGLHIDEAVHSVATFVRTLICEYGLRIQS